VTAQRGWSEEVAQELARRALSSLGLEPASVRLLKFGAIANFRVESPPRFLKVADPGFRSAEPVLRRSLAVSRWLDENGVAVAPAADEAAARPVAVDGAWAGLWVWREHCGERSDPRAAGALLRQAHEALAACPVPLPEIDHLDAATRHIPPLGEPGNVDEAEIEFLTEEAERIAGRWTRFESELGVGPIHGDFEVDNVLATDRGPVLIDLDNAQVAPREWDLVKATPGSRGGWREDEWPAFAAGYGYDLLAAAGSDVLRDVRHLRSLVWMLGDARYAERFSRGRELLREWMATPQKRCFELRWR
jgi:Ser/Thr protein kinase RdoA (MazF antagonist)